VICAIVGGCNSVRAIQSIIQRDLRTGIQPAGQRQSNAIHVHGQSVHGCHAALHAIDRILK